MKPHTLKTKVLTPKLAETRDFYVQHLGMRVVEAWEEPGDAGCILSFQGPSPQAFLELYLSARTPDLSGVSLQFRTEDLDAFAAALPPALNARGPVARPWGSRYLYLEDPNGVEVVVFEGGL